MSPRVLLLIGSAVLNAALLGAFVTRPSLAPVAVRSFFQSHSSLDDRSAFTAATAAATRTAAARAENQSAAGARTNLWAALDSEDPPTLIARLRAAGFSRAVVLAVLNTKLDARFADRFRALNGDLEQVAYWKPDPMNSPNNAKYWEEYSQIYRERSRMLRELLGDDAMGWGGTDPAVAQRRQFGNLPKEKIDLVQRINDDYTEMTSQVRASTLGITLPEDREKLALLEREKRADLAGVLTPAELEEYEMRTSPVTSRLRNALSIMDASEAEFRAIFKAYQPFNDRINPSGPGMIGTDFMEQRRQAQQQFSEQLKTVLPPDRVAAYTRASNVEFQQLHRIAQRDGVPMDTAVRAFGIRDSITAESTRIADDPALTAEQRRTALQSLAHQGRTQILGTLGPGTGEAYVRVASRWLSYLENGSAITMGADGMPVPRRVAPPLPPRK